MEEFKRLSYKRNSILFIIFFVLIGLSLPGVIYAAPCSIGNTNPSPGIEGQPFSFSLGASHTHPNSQLFWTVVWAPSAPPGVPEISRAGEGTKNTVVTYDGTATTAGAYTVTATITDAFAKCTASILVDTYVIDPPAVLQITTLSLPDGEESVVYLKQVTASGGVPPYTWNMAGLPAGLAFDAATGEISGTPAAGTAGNYNITITVNDSAANVATTTIVLTITGPGAALNILTVGLPDGDEGIPYSYSLSGIGGSMPYSWTVAGLPAGLAFSAATGLISGTPAAGSAGDYPINVTLNDSAFNTDVAAFNLHINAAAVVITSPLSEYCIKPPFIPTEVPPNLLLTIDNSASMYDLVYIDVGTDVRDPVYCYDQTFATTGTYSGYFDEAEIYEYDFVTDFRFEPGAAFPGICNYEIPGVLCVVTVGAPPTSVTGFYATGKYLNWITASKFDIEKGILTGGKYDTVTGELISESRGCVGMRYIKEPLDADYIEAGVNTPLGITFGVRGPRNPFNPTTPSLGGQTLIEIFVGDYNEADCQAAIEVFSDPATYGHIDRRNAAELCLNYDPHDASLPGKTKNVFIQTIQECYQFDIDTTPPQEVGFDARNTVYNQCPDVYDGFSPGRCSANTAVICTVDADCPDFAIGEFCIAGPKAIFPGNPAYLCSSDYAGACYDGTVPYAKENYVDYSVGDCVLPQHNAFCGDINRPPVIDPTDNTLSTEGSGNVPAILGDLGLEGQLGDPIATLRVRAQAAAPEGLVQEFADIIRVGAMTFNFNGSPSECVEDDAIGYDPVAHIKCPRVCSTSFNITCSEDFECPSGETCIQASASADIDNIDSARIVAKVGAAVGNHNSGLVKALDDIRATTWTPFAEGFYNAIAYYTQNSNSADDPALMPVRLSASDFASLDAGDAGAEDPVQNNCQENHILLISDGMSTADLNPTVINFVNSYNDGDTNLTTALPTGVTVAPTYYGSANVDDVAWYAKNNNIFDPTAAIEKPSHTITSHVVYSGPPCTTKEADGVTCAGTDETNLPEELMQETADNGQGEYFLSENPAQLEANLRALFDKLARDTASGTAASVLASGEGSGANLVQAVFYPTRNFSGTDIRWTGRLTNLWFFVDPFFGSSAIYEDNDSTGILDLTDDYKISMFYDAAAKQSMATRSVDTDGDGVPDDVPPAPDATVVEFETVESLWEAGLQLWLRDLATDPRKIKTTVDGSTLIDLSIGNEPTLRGYLQAANATEGENIINYTNGYDIAGYRPRTVQVDWNNDAGTGDPDGDVNDADENAKVWKLGDVIQSTPRLASLFQLNFYDQLYSDSTYAEFIGNASPVDYRSRGLVFTGANDGMLHAFRLGKLEVDWVGQGTFEKARLSIDPVGTTNGEEVWAYIPRSVLPYLKFMGDNTYCHLYSVDLSPYIFDASICAPGDCAGNYWTQAKTVNSWRTILIGGMRFGGGCRTSDTVCADVSGDGAEDCVNTPGVDINLDGSVSGVAETSLGMSTYFALDITNTLQDPTQDPQLLWEFTRPDLGFTSPGPAIVKINDKTGDTNSDGRLDGDDPSDTSNNGRWFAVFASGPTGPISDDNQFLGRSDQNLKVFVVDLKTGVLATAAPLDTTVPNAFAGSMLNSNDDLDKDYQDDVIYVPYVKRTGAVPNFTWTDGGVGRIVTNEDLNPDNWVMSPVIDGIGPVTSAVVRLFHQRRSDQWLFFGTGRYFFEQDVPDDPTGQNRLFGLKDPCYSSTGFASPCPAVGVLTDVTDINNVPTDPVVVNAMNGWVIDLDGVATIAGEDFRSERVITDPLAVSTGLVFFTTFTPKDDSCDPEGRSFIWATTYNTGGDPGALLKGKALLQVSTGNIEQVDLSTAFVEKGGRRTAAMEGVPPVSQGLSILTTPPPVKRLIHMRER
jgi:type IV pilus assembly protein PilY1